LVLDEPKDDDSVFDVEGFQYIINKDLMEKAQPIKIDFLQMGFKIDSSMEFAQNTGCGGCSCG